MDVKFPDVTVELVGVDSNVGAIIGTVSRELRRAGHGDVVSEFREEATSGDYDNVLQTCMRWVNVA